MRKHTILWGLIGFLLSLTLPNIAFAALIEYSWAPGLVYDSAQNITWLKDANYAKTSGYAGASPEGVMDWYSATKWASELVFISGGTAYDDWRLPGTPGTSLRIIEGEMGQLNLLYGIRSDSPGPFINLVDQDYWTSNETGPDLHAAAYYFTFAPAYLGQYAVDKTYIGWDPHAWAVRDGAPVPPGTPVPEPASLSLLGAGLGLIGLAAWRSRK